MSRPLFSVVIPTFHRNDRLATALDCLAPGRQHEMTVAAAGGVADHPDEVATYEVIVSDAGLGSTAQALIATRYPWVRWSAAPGAGPAANRNSGARLARGEWLAFVDDDCQPTPGWLAALTSQARLGDVDVIEGSMIAPDKRDSIRHQAVDNLTGDLYWSGNLAIRHDVFDRLGRFDEDFQEACCEDVEFADRIRKSGVRTVFCPAGAVLHPCHVVTPSYLFRRTLRARWHLLYMHKTGKAVSPTEPAWRALAYLMAYRTRSLLSITRRIAHQYPGRPKTALFNVTLEWLTFPLVVPYLMFWELRFRERLLDRRHAG